MPGIIEIENRLYYSDGKIIFKYHEHGSNKSTNVSILYNF